MSVFDQFRRISQAPTNPHGTAPPRQFDIADLYQGPLGESADAGPALQLDEKLRQAYFWVVNHAIISPHYDIEYHDGPSATYAIGHSKRTLRLPSAQSYSSFVLLPLLTFATRGKCLLIGGPGRGKTASALLMGVLAGYPVREVRRGMQHGHPQLTIADLLGNPLPADLVQAQKMEDIRIAWRSWLSMRVKIVDEYNRIPTRTQSALLTVLGDNYAEVMNQVYECPDAAWFLTANDDQGGGTYQVIEALRDRIDVVVQALAFNPRFLDELLLRIESNVRPESMVPPEIIFTQAESDAMASAIRATAVPTGIRRRLSFFASQFELMEAAGDQFEYLTKDTARLASTDWTQLTSSDTGRDRLADLGAQTRNGLSVRNLMALLSYAKALAFFRGMAEVELEDLRQVLPFVMHGKLQPDMDAPFFALPENAPLRSDRLSWLRRLFDLSNAEYDRLDLDRNDPVSALESEFAQGLDGLSAVEAKRRLVKIEQVIQTLSKGRKLYGPLYDDLLKLKYLHQRYSNYLRWVAAR